MLSSLKCSTAVLTSREGAATSLMQMGFEYGEGRPKACKENAQSYKLLITANAAGLRASL